MSSFFQALTDPNITFLRYALIAGIISSIPFGIIGSFVVVKRMSYIAGAVCHSVLGGIGIALYMNEVLHVGFITPTVGALIFAIFSGLVISAAVIFIKERLDTIIGVIWAIGMSIGLLFMHKTPGYNDPMSYLFGNILMISRQDLILIAIMNVVIITLSLLFYNQLLAIAFDDEFARIRGLHSSFFQIVLILLISMTIFLMISIVGIVMVIALLTIPPAISSIFCHRFKNVILLSCILCMFFMIFGLYIGFVADLPTGSLTVIVAGVGYILSWCGSILASKFLLKK